MISPLEAARAAADVDLPPRLSHTFVVLALFFPDVRPTQEQLARMLHVSERTVNYRMLELERLGRVRRTRGKSGRATSYRIILHKVVSPESEVQASHQEQLSAPPTEPVGGWEF